MCDLEKIRAVNAEKLKQINKKESDKKEKLVKKFEAFNSLLISLNVTIDDVLNSYNNSCFRDTSISKKDVFYQILTHTLTEENKNFLIESGLKVSSHQKDKRTPDAYAIDLVLGWLIEDAILVYMILKEIPAKLQGADYKREFLEQNELDTTPDIIIGDRQLEIVCDWGDYWMENGKADLRDNKFHRLVKENAYLFGLSPKSGMGFLIDISDKSHGFEYNKAIYGYGFKPGFTSTRIKDYMKPINEIFDELYKIFKEKESIVL